MIIAQTTILKRREKLPGFEESELLRGLFSIQFHLIRLNWLLETRVLGRIVSTAIDPERLLGFLQDSKVISRIVVSNLIFWYRTGFWESSTVSLSLSLSLPSLSLIEEEKKVSKIHSGFFRDSCVMLAGEETYPVKGTRWKELETLNITTCWSFLSSLLIFVSVIWFPSDVGSVQSSRDTCRYFSCSDLRPGRRYSPDVSRSGINTVSQFRSRASDCRALLQKHELSHIEYKW